MYSNTTLTTIVPPCTVYDQFYKYVPCKRKIYSAPTHYIDILLKHWQQLDVIPPLE